MDTDNKEKTCIANQTQPSGRMFMEFTNCTDQIHKLGEDFTRSLGNRLRRGEEGEDSDRGEDRERKNEAYR